MVAFFLPFHVTTPTSITRARFNVSISTTLSFLTSFDSTLWIVFIHILDHVKYTRSVYVDQEMAGKRMLEVWSMDSYRRDRKIESDQRYCQFPLFAVQLLHWLLTLL